MTDNNNVVDCFTSGVLSERQYLTGKIKSEQARAQQHEKHLRHLEVKNSNHEKMIGSDNDELQRELAALNTAKLYLRTLKKSVLSFQQQERNLQEKLSLQAQISAAKYELTADEEKYKCLLVTIATKERELKVSQGIVELEESLKELQEKYASKERYLRSLKEQISRQKEKRASAKHSIIKLAELHRDTEVAKETIKSINNQIQQLTIERDLQVQRWKKPQEKAAAGKRLFELLPITRAPSEESAPSPTKLARSIYFDKQSRHRASAMTAPPETLHVQDTTGAVQDTTGAVPKPTPRSPHLAKPAKSTSASGKESIHRALELLESTHCQAIPPASSTYLDDLRTLMFTPRPSLPKRPLEMDVQKGDVVPAKQPCNKREQALPKPVATEGPESGIQIPSLPCITAAAAKPQGREYQDMQTTEPPELSYEYAKEQDKESGFPNSEIQESIPSVPLSFGSNQERSSASPKRKPADTASGSTKLSTTDSDILKFDTFDCDNPDEVYDIFGDDDAGVQEEASGFQLAPAHFGQGQRKRLF